MSQNFDFFSLVVSPTQENRPINEWWWMDICHNLKTSDFARALWKNAGSDSELQAYTYGYLTHIAGDAIVHPYVNLISGGPYRLHPRRHVLVEKAFDSYVLDKWYNLRVSDCAWHEKIEFQAGDPFPNLPDKIAELIYASLDETYGSLGIDSGVPSKDDINLMYRFISMTLKGATAMGSLNLAPPDFSLIDMPKEIREIFDKPPPAIKHPSDLTSSDDWLAFLLSILAFVTWAFETLLKLVYVSVSIIAQLASAPFRFFLWLIQKMLYEIYLNARLILSLGGFLHPARRHLGYFKNINNPPIDEYREYSNRFPFEKYVTKEQSYHLIFPSFSSESPNAYPFSLHPTGSPLTNVTTSAFFDVCSPLIGDATQGPYEDLMSICSLTGSADVRQFVEQKNGFVSARTLALSIFKDFEAHAGKNVPNFNLDGDRGYAWPSWSYSDQPGSWNDQSFQFEC